MNRAWQILRVVAVAAIALATALPPCAVVAQEAGAEQEPPVEQRTPVDRSAIQSRIQALEQIEESDGLTETQEEEIAQLNEALSWLQRATRFRQEMESFDERTRTAPEEVRQLEETLAKPIEEEIPAIDDSASLDALESQRDTARVELEAARSQRAGIDDETTRRDARREAIPIEQAALTQRIAQINARLDASPDPEADANLVRARRWYLLAELHARELKEQRNEAERRSYDARRELLPKRRQLAERRVVIAERHLNTLNDVVSRKRVEAAAEAERQAREEEREAADEHEVLQQVLSRNRALTEQRTAVTEKTQRETERLERVRTTLHHLKVEFEQSQALVRDVGMIDAVGLRLRNERARLPAAFEHEQARKRVQAEMREAQLAINDIQHELRQTIDLDAAATAWIEELDVRMPAQRREALYSVVRSALETQRSHLTSLEAAYQAYLRDTLTPLNHAERDLLAAIETYRDFIDQRVLWIQSVEPLSLETIRDLGPVVVAFLDGTTWTSIVQALWDTALDDPAANIAMLLILITVLVTQGRARRKLDDSAADVRRITKDKFSLTLVAAALTVLIALPGPTVAWIMGTLLVNATDTTGIAHGVGAGLLRVAFFWLALGVLRHVYRPSGLAESHFQWKKHTISVMRTHLHWVTPAVLPLVFLVTATESIGAEASNALGRLAFIVGMFVAALLVWKIMHPTRGIPKSLLQRRAGGWLDRLRGVWFVLLLTIPVGLAIASGVGYYYTAIKLERLAFESLLMVLVAIVVHAMSLRWLELAQRQLAIDQWLKKREAQQQAGQAREEPTTEPQQLVSLDDAQLDVEAVSTQTRRLVNSVVGLGLVIGIAIVWADVLPAFGILREVELWSEGTGVEAISFDTADTSGLTQAGADGAPDAGAAAADSGQDATGVITLANIVLAIIIVIITIIVSQNTPGLLEITILQRLPMTAGGRYAITTIARYSLVIIGIVIAFNEIGIGWSKVQWLAAAITVGLGFGLQEIFANFVSGLIILLERPIRVGDTVTVGTVHGKVSRIRMRATTIVDWDRKELITPNKEFVTGQVINWTLTDSIMRITIRVGVAYGSDTQLVKQTLLKVAKNSDLVLDAPGPQAIFLGFGDSSLNFELRVFISSIESYLPVLDGMHMDIDAAFRKEDIEISFPQRDLHIRSVKAPFEIVQQSTDPGNASPAGE